MKQTRHLLLMLLLLAAATTMAGNSAKSNIFSQSLKKGTPVLITNNRNKDYSIKFSAQKKSVDTPVASGITAYTADEIWYLVGTADAFILYNHAAGKKLAVRLESNNSGASATIADAKKATPLALTAQPDGSYTISPASNKEQSLNMFGGAGRNIKLYSSNDNGGCWKITPVDLDRPLKLKYTINTEGALATNTRIGEIILAVNGNTSRTMLNKENLPEQSTCYLPIGAKIRISTGLMCHGWEMQINKSTAIQEQNIPQKGIEVNIDIAATPNNRYQYLFHSPDEKGIPYRIPAIVTTANGYVFAINDYRPCGNDIGFGEVDLVMRHSTNSGSEWDGHSWSEPIKIADGLGKQAPETWLTGFGDPAVVADRERNEILVMSVCGNRICWHGNYGAGTPENPENPNRMARLRIKYNEQSGEWEVGTPEEVTYDIYPLFKDNAGKAHVGSMFIGAGRMAQSSMIKVGDYYRIYCAVWAVETGNHRHHNYALYSDDFGDTWHLLGELGEDFNDSPAPYGNEPKCEELPDGSVLLSSRKGYGRYFNVFHYTNFEKAEGYWDGAVATDKVGDLKFGRNDTNGEPLRIGNILLQSVPTGDSRSNVAIYCKQLSDDPATYTPAELSKGWKKIAISNRGSAYSSMCILPDGKSIGLYYEEEPGGYSMVYVPVEIESVVEAVEKNACEICGE